MKEVKLSLSNREQAALRREIRTFMRVYLVPKMTGQKPDKNDSATPTYAVLDRLLREIGGGVGK